MCWVVRQRIACGRLKLTSQVAVGLGAVRRKTTNRLRAIKTQFMAFEAEQVASVVRQRIACGRLKRRMLKPVVASYSRHGRKTTNRLRAIKTFVFLADRQACHSVVVRQRIACGRLKLSRMVGHLTGPRCRKTTNRLRAIETNGPEGGHNLCVHRRKTTNRLRAIETNASDLYAGSLPRRKTTNRLRAIETLT